VPSLAVGRLNLLAGGQIPYGQQHSTLVSLTGTLRARRVCEPAILACLLAVNEQQCERPGAPKGYRAHRDVESEVGKNG